MILRLQQWLLLGLALALLALVIANILFYQGNLGRQQEVNERQAFIQQIQQVELPLYREIAQALAELARRGDQQIGYLLSNQGIQVNNAPQATASPQQPAAQQAPASAPASAAQAPAQADPAADRNSRWRGRSHTPAAPAAPATPAAPAANRP